MRPHYAVISCGVGNSYGHPHGETLSLLHASGAEVLRTETELFYEMLASVNLPEAQKESMTESYYRLKRILEAEE